MLTLLAVAICGTMPSPFPLCSGKLSDTSPPSSSMGLGASFRSTAVASLCSLEKPGREMGGLCGGGMCVNPVEWELSVKCRPGNAGVLPVLSERSEVSWMSGRRSAIARVECGDSLPLVLLPRGKFQPSIGIPYRRVATCVAQLKRFVLRGSLQLCRKWFCTKRPTIRS
jgi:hypothetical protein